MSEIDRPPMNTPAFIGPRAAEVAFQDGYMLTANPAAIDEIIRTTAEFDESFGRLSPEAEVVTASELALVIRGCNIAQKPTPWDVPWHREKLGAFYPIDQLAEAEMRTMRAVTRSEINALGNHVIELKVTDFSASIGVVLAAVLVGVQPRGYTRQERSLSTATTSKPILAQRQIKAMNAVEDQGLEPFIVTRKSDIETAS